MKTGTEQEAQPVDSTKGQFLYNLEQFCVKRHVGKSREDLLRRKPWSEAGRTYFRSTDLMAFLERNRFKAFTERKVWSILRETGGHIQYAIKGRCVQCWWIPEFAQQTEDFTTPQIQPEEF